MGLFGGKKTYVSSTLYNLAGDIENRPDFLKTLVVGNVLSASNPSISDSIQQGYSGGPGLKLRTFYRWAAENYTLIGLPEGSFSELVQRPADVVGSQIQHEPEQTPVIQQFEISMADFSYWAEQWMFDNHYDLISTNWMSDYDDTTGEIKITFEDGSVEEFTPVDFDKNAAYLFATYILSSSDIPGDSEVNDPVYIGLDDPYPSTDGYTLINEESSSKTVTLTTRTRYYYESTGPESGEEETTTEDKTIQFYQADWSKVTFNGGSSSKDQITSTQDNYTFVRTGEVHEGETSVRKFNQANPETGQPDVYVIEITKDTLTEAKYYVKSKQDITDYDWTKARTFIYRIGSGNTVLDQFIVQGGNNGSYLPFIPVRLDNKFLSEAYQPAAYRVAKKAYKKAVNGKFDEVVDILKDNKDLKDIDYAYIMFGVSLNIKDNSCKKYIYNFFKNLSTNQGTDIHDYNDWKLNQAIGEATNNTWLIWRAAQNDPTSPLFGTAEPANANYNSIPTSQIQIKASGSIPTNVDMRITWQDISETMHTGLGKVNAKVGEVWFDFLADDIYDYDSYSNGQIINSNQLNVNRLNLKWQTSENTYQVLHITGLVHRNYIYNGKYVEITAKQAFADTEESGFLIPLHYNTLRGMSLVDSTQVSTCSCYMVLNSYQVVKQKWYQTGIFKIVLVLVVIGITYATGGFGAGSIGLLGANAAVGAALGASGALAAVVGAVANALVAMILVKLVSIGAVAVFGDKLGTIIGTIASLVALQVGTALSNGTSLSASIAQLAKADNILKLTMAAGNGYSDYIRAGAMETIQKTEELKKEYESKSQEISDLYAQNFGYGRGVFDPMSLTEATSFIMETRASFLDRTLMTGSDVADMSLTMIRDFTDITLSTKLPG